MFNYRKWEELDLDKMFQPHHGSRAELKQTYEAIGVMLENQQATVDILMRVCPLLAACFDNEVD